MVFFQLISYIYLWTAAQKHISLRKNFKLLKRHTEVAKATHLDTGGEERKDLYVQML